MMKSKFMLTALLIGSLLIISSCTSNDARSVSSENSDLLADLTDNKDSSSNIDDHFSEIENLEKELEELSELDLSEIEF